jgi:anti-anti-sigma regulatory factor
MLKLTKDEAADVVTLRLDGRVAGPWVSEFEKVWRSLAAVLGARKLLVDLRGVTFMNADGRQLLSVMCRETGAQFLADTPMTQYFAEEAKRGVPSESEKGR